MMKAATKEPSFRRAPSEDWYRVKSIKIRSNIASANTTNSTAMAALNHGVALMDPNVREIPNTTTTPSAPVRRGNTQAVGRTQRETAPARPGLGARADKGQVDRESAAARRASG